MASYDMVGITCCRALSDGGGGPGASGGMNSPRSRLALRDTSRDPNRPAPNPDDPHYLEELEAEVMELRDLRVLLLVGWCRLNPG